MKIKGKKGADQAAQAGCLDSGGQVISVVADALHSHLEQPNVLYLSEEDYDMPFSTLRALRRNRVIHALGQVVLVAQSRAGRNLEWHCQESPEPMDASPGSGRWQRGRSGPGISGPGGFGSDDWLP